MSLNLSELAFLKDIEELQIATRRVIRGLEAAPQSLQDVISLALSQWVSTMSTVANTIKAGAELRGQADPPPPGNNNSNNGENN